MREKNFDRRRFLARITSADHVYSAILDTDGQILATNGPWAERSWEPDCGRAFPPSGCGIASDDGTCLGLARRDAAAVRSALNDVTAGRRDEWALETLETDCPNQMVSAVYLLSIDFPDGQRGVLLAMPVYDTLLDDTDGSFGVDADEAARPCRRNEATGHLETNEPQAFVSSQRSPNLLEQDGLAAMKLRKDAEPHVANAQAAMEHVLKTKTERNLLDDFFPPSVSAAKIFSDLREHFWGHAKASNVNLIMNRDYLNSGFQACEESLRYCLFDILRASIDSVPSGSSVMLSARPSATGMNFEVRYGWPVFNKAPIPCNASVVRPMRRKFSASIAKAICEMEQWTLSFDHDCVLGGSVVIGIPALPALETSVFEGQPCADFKEPNR